MTAICINFVGRKFCRIKSAGSQPVCLKGNEPPYDKTKKMACTPSEDSDQPGHPASLIRVFAVCMKKAWVHSYPLSAQRRLWSDWADAQADLSLCLAHSHFVGFVMRWLKLLLFQSKCQSLGTVYCNSISESEFCPFYGQFQWNIILFRQVHPYNIQYLLHKK